MTQYEYAVRSLLGSREEQQDRYVIRHSGGCLLAAVCDGMGGSEDGAGAAEMTVRLLEDAFLLRRQEPIPHFFLHHIERISAAVYAQFQEKPRYSGTTLAACILDGDQIYWLSVGDSRIYLVKDGQLLPMTVDHNYARVLDKRLQNGEITPETYRMEQGRGHALTSYIGQKRLNEVCMNVQPLPWGDAQAVIVMSDGLYHLLTPEEIAACTASDVQTAAARLESLIHAKQCRQLDNTTFIIIKRST